MTDELDQLIEQTRKEKLLRGERLLKLKQTSEQISHLLDTEEIDGDVTVTTRRGDERVELRLYPECIGYIPWVVVEKRHSWDKIMVSTDHSMARKNENGDAVVTLIQTM